MEVVVKKKIQRKGYRFILYAFIALVLLLALLLGFVNSYLHKAVPPLSGEMVIDGLTEEVSVVRDKEGVPHISARNERDLFIAQGYVTAQERLFQMDMSRRQASGELSEVVGDATIERDKFFRTFGLKRAAIASYDVYSDEGKNVLQWYADGVNAFIEEAKKENRLPVEFTLLGYEPKEWTPFDSLTIGKYMAYDLGGHWRGQAFRHYLMQKLPKEKAYELFPSYPKDAPTIVESTNIDVEKSFASVVFPNEFNGSNNWVISGEKSVSGKPLLADDPHLSLATPAIWYQTQLQTPDMNVSGVIFAGVPGIILGHNEHVAWGVTNVGPDVQDLYIEKRNPANKTQFLYNDKWENAEIYRETIKVKGETAIPYEVVVTRHGPVISEFAHDNGNDKVLSMRWTAHDPSPELEAILKLNKATNWTEFEKGLELFHTPAQNFVFAAKDGTIAYKANGKIPIRKKGASMVPVPGWTDEYEWNGYIPFDKLPTVINPSEGFIATANNKVVNDTYPYHISYTWAQPYRQMRIVEVLKSKEKFTVEDMQQLQMDQVNLQAKEFVPIFLQAFEQVSLTEKEKQAVAALEEWNYVDDKEFAAPLIFHTLIEKVENVLFKDDISEKMLELFSGKGNIVDELLRKAAKGEKSIWIHEKGGLPAVLHAALKETIDEVSEAQGNKIEKWKWGEKHQLAFLHPLSNVSALKWMFNWKNPVPVGGSHVTVQAAGWNKKTGLVNHGASWRFVIDAADLTKGYHVVGPGQSGHVKSEWYDNQIQDWADGIYHVTSLKEEGAKENTLLLMPKTKKNE
ncbi:penicillin acylase family protein [Priestia taiwanensis]|uniref:Beta-lactam antibiotic acylase n=1 Tax=Priestia taiwanensis TaxID=1347902 RepID=A0A917AXB5_9BACI|nr:penicillin acylase family protein [Priestia taiwanensis]MBM7363373.1 penicillin amidase [Priestia taiwanensis]GGE77701.1 beta-lactam antibiotic acylase [Priestia taiwanensis]